jgi:streptomycin 6-kinase
MDNKLNYYKQLWELTADGDAFSTCSGLLQPVTYKGEKCMLKIARREKDKPGMALMGWWNGNGSARLLRYDTSAILIERARGSGSLASMVHTGSDDEASRIICSMVSKLHAAKGRCPVALPPLDVKFNDLASTARKHGGVFVQSSLLAAQLLKNPVDLVVLHGDIHHNNILDFGPKGWLTIDPKGMFGERTFDYANLFCNPDIETASRPGRMVRQVAIVAKEAGLDPVRLLQWIAAWAGLSAAWAMEDGVSAEPAMTVAKIALGELGFY